VAPPPYCMGFLLNWRPHNTVNIVALFIQKYACAIYRRYTSACRSEICKSIVEFIYRNMHALHTAVIHQQE
jgi:hypothetical protein